MEYKKEDLKEIINKKYNIKQALAYYILGFNESEEKDVDVIVKNVIKKMLDIKKLDQALEKVDSKLLAEIKNYWNISLEELVAYAYIIFQNLTQGNQKIRKKDILKSFIDAMRLYAPNEAVEYVERNHLMEWRQ